MGKCYKHIKSDRILNSKETNMIDFDKKLFVEVECKSKSNIRLYILLALFVLLTIIVIIIASVYS